MDFYAVLDEVLELLQRHKRVTYRALKRQFGLDDAYLEDLKAEIIEAPACRRSGRYHAGLVWGPRIASTSGRAGQYTEPCATHLYTETPGREDSHVAQRAGRRA